MINYDRRNGKYSYDVILQVDDWYTDVCDRWHIAELPRNWEEDYYHTISYPDTPCVVYLPRFA